LFFFLPTHSYLMKVIPETRGAR